MITNFDSPKPSGLTLPVGLGPGGVGAVPQLAERLQRLRRRREWLEAYYSPAVSCGVSPSTVDRLVLWRSHHGRHHD